MHRCFNNFNQSYLFHCSYVSIIGRCWEQNTMLEEKPFALTNLNYSDVTQTYNRGSEIYLERTKAETSVFLWSVP